MMNDGGVLRETPMYLHIVHGPDESQAEISGQDAQKLVRIGILQLTKREEHYGRLHVSHYAVKENS